MKLHPPTDSTCTRCGYHGPGPSHDCNPPLIEDQIAVWREDDEQGYNLAIELICEAEEALRTRLSVLDRCRKVLSQPDHEDQDLMFDLGELLGNFGGSSASIEMVNVDHHGEAELKLNVSGMTGSVFVSRDMWNAMSEQFDKLSAARCARCMGIGMLTYDTDNGWRDPCPACKKEFLEVPNPNKETP